MSKNNGKKKHQKWKLICVLLLLSLLLAGCTDSLREDVSQEGSGSEETGSEVETEDSQSGSMTFPKYLQEETAEQENPETAGQMQQEAPQSEDPEAEEQSEELRVYFLDVGQGDSTLITCKGEAMLIDAGDNDRGTQIQNVLQKNGIKKLDYVVMTHPDADHIGGMDVILYKFDCETIFMTDYKKETETYRDVLDTMKEKGYKATAPVVGETYELADASFEILAPNATYEDANNNSIALLLTFGETRFLFTGDCEEAAEADIVKNGIDIQADVYQVGHHGSRNASSQALLDQVQPTYAVISCETDNSYGHPHAETLNKFRIMGVQVFRTDEQGTIVADSDGSRITFHCAPSDTWKAGEPTGAGETDNSSMGKADEAANEIRTQAGAGVRYVLNKNTMKYHLPECSSAADIKPSNREETALTKEEIEAQGYVGCKRCNP